VSLCARWGVGEEALLEGTGLSLEALKDPTTRLALPACEALVERARSLTHEPGLAFSMGLQMRLSWHGFLGFAAMTAGNVREALELGERFSLTRTAAFGLATYVEGASASIVLEERLPPGPLREFAVITLLVGIWQIGVAVTGRSLSGVAECSFPEPAYATAILSRFGAQRAGSMLFGRRVNRLVFDASFLDLPLVNADPVAMQLARAQCDRELGALAEAGSFVGRVRAATTRSGDGFRALDDVARALHVSTRTLKRRLAGQGTSFSAILDGVRQQRALLLLEDRRLGLADIAARLGYSDVTNFTRAFRRWMGESPAAFRRARVLCD
jgi:AraC-like DNA-binding protein